MSNLGLRTIQIDSHYLIWETLEEAQKKEIIRAFRDKVVYLFNLNFYASQLKHAGFHTDANKWYDVALLARLCENRLMDKLNDFSLGNLTLNLLGYKTKEDLLDELMVKFKVRSLDALFALKG